MSIEKPKQNFDSKVEHRQETLRVDLALEVKEAKNQEYLELISFIDKKYAGKYEFAANILKRYIKNEILAQNNRDGSADFSKILGVIDQNVEKFGKVFDTMLANLSNNDFAKKLGLNSASIEAARVVESASYAGVTNKYQMALVKIYSLLKFTKSSEQNLYLTDTLEEEVKSLPLPEILKKFDQITA